MIDKNSQSRIYVIDKSGFLSCGRAYITDTQNKIIMKEDNNLLSFDGGVPYTLAPRTLRSSDDWTDPIKKGIKVYPSCDVDTPSWQWDDAKENFNPTILDMIVLLQKDLRDYVSVYNEQSKDFSAKVAIESKRIDEKYAPQQMEIEEKILHEKVKVWGKHTCPDLATLILNG